MTDSNHTPNQSPTSDPPDYEGTDPDLPDRQRSDQDKPGPRIGVSTVQVGASAAAAVTSALAASFFGVAGTLIGAAVGSVVSTLAGALYSHYLGRAGARIKETKEVVIQRIPGEVLSVTPLRHLTRPTDLPGRTSLQPIGDERGNESITAPVEEAGQLRQRPTGLAPLHQNGAGGPTLNGTGGGGPASPPVRSPWKRPAMAMGAVSMAGFLISIGVVLATEAALGHPVSGGESGNSLSGTIPKVVDSDTKSDEVTPSETSTPSEASQRALATRSSASMLSPITWMPKARPASTQ
jgi:hypothetical protein